MEFRTTFQIPESNFKINHQHKIITIGSCFSDEMGNRLVELKFEGLINPYGIIFNSYSIQKLIERSIHKKYFTSEDVHQNGEQFFCYDVHSSFNKLTESEILNHLNSILDQVHHQLFNCDVLMVTLGTSWVYERIQNSEIVANCHKVEAKHFKKILLSTEENFKNLDLLVFEIIKINPKAKIIITVSPVRHIKDGIIENNVSKARLVDALYQLNLKYSQVEYFPAYELILDDLRDYRFYKEDMIHPTNQAVEYIWKKFVETYFDESTQTVNQKINKIISALKHRPFNEKSESYQKFLNKILLMIRELETGEVLDFTAEKKIIKERIKSC